MNVQRTHQSAPSLKRLKHAAAAATITCIMGLFACGGLLATNVTNTVPPVGLQFPPREVMSPDTASFGIIGTCVTTSAQGVCVSGGIAYVADYNSGLRCVNVSDPVNPAVLGTCVTYRALGVAVAGGIAYVADAGMGLRSINISNPADPRLLATCSTGGAAYGVTVAGGVAYVADSVSGLQCVNVTNPRNLVLLDNYDTGNNARGVCVAGGVAYVVDRYLGLYCINVSNPLDLTFLGSNDTGDDARGVCVDRGIAYVADAASGLRCVSVSNPVDPKIIGTHSTSGANDVAVDGSVAYITNGSAGLRCVNMTNPAVPALLATYDTPGNAYGVDVAGGVAYIADGSSGLQCVAIAVLTSPTLLGTFDTSGNAIGVAMSGGVAYVADYGEGLVYVNVTNPFSPDWLGTWSGGALSRGVALSGGFAYVAADFSGLRCVNVTNPAAPAWLTDVSTYRAMDVCVSGDVAYVADELQGLACIDISNPADPSAGGISNDWGFHVEAFSACDYGGIAYAWNYYDDNGVPDLGDGHLVYVNVSNPRDPAFIGSYPSFYTAFDMCISGDVLYWVGGDLGCFNISNPVNPTPLGYTSTPGTATGVCVSGGIAYVADGDAGLQIYNVSNPASPTPLSSYDTPGTATDVCVSGSVAYVADGDSGLQCIQVNYHEWDRPLVVDSEAGDDTWRGAAGTTYDVDFLATMANLSYVQYRICNVSGQGGTVIHDWTNISTGINARTYTTDWDVNFTACREGANYISVRAVDYAGAAQNATDVFIVRKDTAAPGITDNQLWDDLWDSGPGVTYDVDFADSLSNLSTGQYKICSAAGQGGAVFKDWTDLFAGINEANFTTDWTVDFTACQEGINYVSVRLSDRAGNVEIATDVFCVGKDSAAPTIQVHTAASLTYTTCPMINVTFEDVTSHLKQACYKVDSLAPGGTNTQGWVFLFADAVSASENIEFALDASTWAGLTDGTHVVYFKVWDNANNVTEGAAFAWQFVKYTEPSDGDTDGFLTGLLVGIIVGAVIVGVFALLIWFRSRKDPNRIVPPTIGGEQKLNAKVVTIEAKPTPKVAPKPAPAKKVDAPKSPPAPAPAKKVGAPKPTTKSAETDAKKTATKAS